MTARRSTAALYLFVATLPCCATTPSPEFASALEMAEADRSTREGAEYDRCAANLVAPELPSALEACGYDRRRSFGRITLLYRIDEAGAPVESSSHPDTKFSACVRDRLQFELPEPPHADYWISIELPSPRGAGRPVPSYPRALADQGVEGYVVVEYTLGADGEVQGSEGPYGVDFVFCVRSPDRVRAPRFEACRAPRAAATTSAPGRRTRS